MSLNYREIHDAKYQNDVVYREKLQYQGHPSESLKWLMQYTDLSDRRILDYGCGPGRNAVTLALGGISVEVYDPSSVALSDLRVYIEKHNIQQDIVMIHDVPPTETQYDVIILCYVVHFMPIEEGKALIQTLLGYLNNGGYLCLEYFSPETAGYRADRLYPSSQEVESEIRSQGSYDLLWSEEHTSGEEGAQRVAQMSVWKKGTK